MKKLLYIILISVLMSAVMSCGRSVDKRLVLADTLMWTNPDSSLAILEAINRDSLQGEENLAYYALLLTQAQFRCKGNCTSGTLINSALDYYSDNHNREHYTRSLLYKGAYYEFSTNQPVEAMKWYKQAEENADTTDYRNLAQINFRMGMLYFKNYASNNLDLEKFKCAYKNYQLLGDKKMMLEALNLMALIYSAYNSKLAMKHYDMAQAIAVEVNDTSQIYTILANKGLTCLVDSSYQEAKEYMAQAFLIDSNHISNTNCHVMSQAYANLGNIDSAVFFLNKANKINANDSVMLLRSYRELYLAKKDYAQVHKYEQLLKALTDSLEHKKEKYEICQFENDFNSIRIASKRKESTTWRTLTFALISLFVLSLIILIAFHFKKKRDNLKLIREFRHDNFAHYEQLGNSISDFDSGLSEAMGAKLKVFEEIMTGGYNPNQDSKTNEVAHKISPIADDDTKFWEGLFAYLNYKHDGIMDKISAQFPQLTASDLNFIALTCSDFSDAAIAVCKRYRNTASVRSKRRLIRDKMEIEGTLTKFLDTLKTTN